MVERKKKNKLSQPERVKKQREDLGLTKPSGTREFQIGTTKLSKKEFIAGKGQLGLKGSGKVTPKVEEAIASRTFPKQIAQEKRELEAAPMLEAAGAFEERPSEVTDLQPKGLFEKGGLKEYQQAGIDEERAIFSGKKRAELEIERQQALQEAEEAGRSEFRKKSISTQFKMRKFFSGLGASAVQVLKGAAEIGGEIPIIGEAVKAFTENAPENVRNMQASIVTYRGVADDISTAMEDGSLDTRTGLRDLQKIEKEVNFMTQQIKEFAIGSPVLRTSSELRDVETDLLETQQAIFDAKIVATGQYLVEEDPEILTLKLEALKDKYKKQKDI